MNDHVARQSDVGIRSSFAWSLLGLVIEHPSYGHELVQRFERVYGETMVLRNRTHIYRLLETLRVHHLIEEIDTPEAKMSGRSKPHYGATERGLDAYQDWLVSQAEESRRKARMFVRQLSMLDPEAALAVIEEYERECLEGAGDTAGPEIDRSRDVAERLADEDEHLTFEARASWIDYARRELTALVQQRSGERKAQ